MTHIPFDLFFFVAASSSSLALLRRIKARSSHRDGTAQLASRGVCACSCVPPFAFNSASCLPPPVPALPRASHTGTGCVRRCDNRRRGAHGTGQGRAGQRQLCSERCVLFVCVLLPVSPRSLSPVWSCPSGCSCRSSGWPSCERVQCSVPVPPLPCARRCASPSPVAAAVLSLCPPLGRASQTRRGVEPAGTGKEQAGSGTDSTQGQAGQAVSGRETEG
jgi:hypothetical protein